MAIAKSVRLLGRICVVLSNLLARAWVFKPSINHKGDETHGFNMIKIRDSLSGMKMEGYSAAPICKAVTLPANYWYISYKLPAGWVQRHRQSGIYLVIHRFLTITDKMEF
jgi:hypothetical protein